jgi:hypothetical protein
MNLLLTSVKRNRKRNLYITMVCHFQFQIQRTILKKMPEAGGIDLGALTRRVEQLGGFPHFLLATQTYQVAEPMYQTFVAP